MNLADRLRCPDDRPVDKQAPDTRSLRASLNNISIRLPARRSSRTLCGQLSATEWANMCADRLGIVQRAHGAGLTCWRACLHVDAVAGAKLAGLPLGTGASPGSSCWSDFFVSPANPPI